MVNKMNKYNYCILVFLITLSLPFEMVAQEAPSGVVSKIMKEPGRFEIKKPLRVKDLTPEQLENLRQSGTRPRYDTREKRVVQKNNTKRTMCSVKRKQSSRVKRQYPKSPVAFEQGMRILQPGEDPDTGLVKQIGIKRPTIITGRDETKLSLEEVEAILDEIQYYESSAVKRQAMVKLYEDYQVFQNKEESTLIYPVIMDCFADDQDPLVRAEAAVILGWLKNDEAIEVLVEALEWDENEMVRSSCAKALGFFEPGNKEVLAEALENDPSEKVRGAAAKSLGILEDLM